MSKTKEYARPEAYTTRHIEEAQFGPRDYAGMPLTEVDRILGKDKESRKRKRKKENAEFRKQIKPKLSNAWFFFKLSCKLVLSVLMPRKVKVDPFEAVEARQTELAAKALAKATEHCSRYLGRLLAEEKSFVRASKRGTLNPALSPCWAEQPYAMTENPYLTGEDIEGMVETRPTKKVDIEEEKE